MCNFPVQWLHSRFPIADLYMHVFFSTIVFAAQDTSASATSRALQRLAERPDVQARLRAEVRALRKDAGPGNDDNDESPWDYDALMRLPYLDAIVRETLRLHGPVSWIWRVCVLRSLQLFFVEYSIRKPLRRVHLSALSRLFPLLFPINQKLLIHFIDCLAQCPLNCIQLVFIDFLNIQCATTHHSPTTAAGPLQRRNLSIVRPHCQEPRRYHWYRCRAARRARLGRGCMGVAARALAVRRR